MTVEHRPDAAVALLARRRFDVALLALDLGSTDGLALMRALQARSPGLPVLFLVPEGARDRVARAIREGAADCVGTPIVPEEVGVRVPAALAADAGPLTLLAARAALVMAEERSGSRLRGAVGASLGRLAIQIAHELNNPLGGLKLYTSLLERSLAQEGGRGLELARKVARAV